MIFLIFQILTLNIVAFNFILCIIAALTNAFSLEKSEKIMRWTIIINFVIAFLA